MKVAPPKTIRAKLKLQKRLAASLPPLGDDRWRVLVYNSPHGWIARAVVVRLKPRRNCP